MDTKILCANPHRQYLEQKQEIDQAVQQVLNSDSYILGAEVENFEKEFAKTFDQEFRNTIA